MLRLVVRCQTDDFPALSAVGQRLVWSSRLKELEGELHIVPGRDGWTVFAIGVPGEGGGHAIEMTALLRYVARWPEGLDAELHWAYQHRAPCRYFAGVEEETNA